MTIMLQQTGMAVQDLLKGSRKGERINYIYLFTLSLFVSLFVFNENFSLLLGFRIF